MSKIWGVDLGGTKVECAVLDADSHKVLARRRLPTEAHEGYQHVINQIRKVIDLVSEEADATPDLIGMGTPGSLDPSTGLLKNSNSTILNNHPFLADVENELEVPVRMANDANCFALAEAVMGVVPETFPDAKVVFGVIMGTGAGGGVVFNGNVWNGHHGIGGEWGHNFLDESGGPCYCGKSGCVEKVISGTALEAYYQKVAGRSKSLKEISNDLSDPHAKETIDRLVHFFGLGISTIVNMLDPDVIVIGGGVGNLDVLYSEGVKEIQKYVFNPTFSTPIVRPSLGDSAGVFGAALLTTD